MYPKQLKYTSEICDQINCRLKATPTGVDIELYVWLAYVVMSLNLCLNNVLASYSTSIAIFKLLQAKLVGHVPQCAPPWLHH